MKLRLITTKDDWDLALRKFKEFDDVYFTYPYFELYGLEYNVGIEAVYYQDDNLSVFYPYLVREVNKLKPFLDLPKKLYDLTTPYGYGGLLMRERIKDKDKIEVSVVKFLEEFKDYAFNKNYVSEFVRFHPFFQNWKYFTKTKELKTKYLNDVVAVDLNKNLQELWVGLRKGHQYSIKKSQKEEVRVGLTSKPHLSEIKDFLRCYIETMEKAEAEKKYYFSERFIKNHFKLLKDRAVLAKATIKDKTIGSSIFIWGKEIVHYCLSGMDYNYQNLYPSNLIIWETIKWAKNKNFKTLHLGGGRGANDSLFEFKKGFSKVFYPFYLGKRILNEKAYNELLSLNSFDEADNYFPSYRKNIDKNIV